MEVVSKKYLIKDSMSTDEKKRVNDLESYQILGELEKEDFDFLTKIASQICGTNISLISLVTEDKQWFLSHHGLAIRETPKAFSFCAHAIKNPEDIFIIEDSRKDVRFQENPLVTGYPNVVFYAGVSLVSENGSAIGTLCVIDDSPKYLSDEQIDSLKMLAKQVMQILELRKKALELNKLNAQYLKTEKLFNESQRLNKIGAWELDLTTNIIDWTAEVYHIHGVPTDYDNNLLNAIDFYHPEDRELITNAVQNTIETGEGFDLTCRLIAANGSLKWVRATGIKWDQIAGNPKLIGSFQDISEAKKAKDFLEEAIAKNQAVFDASTLVSLISTDLTGIITGFNKGAELQLGYNAEEVIGKHTPEIFHLKTELDKVGKIISENTGRKVEGFDIFVENAKLGIPERRNWTYLRKDKTTYPILLSVTAIKKNNVITGFLGIGNDITEIKKAEEEIKSLLNISQDQNERLKNFAYIVSHNLRSHSGGIAMLLDLLKDEYPEIYENELLQYLKNSSDNLTETITHLTDVVQINLETKENLKTVALKPIIVKNISSLLSLAKKNKVLITNKVADNITVLGLPAYLDSIIMNFLTNGIKYSSKDRSSYIEISSEVSGDFVILIFKDNGLGIDLEKNRHKIFNIYKTFHSNEDAKGVGLYITKNQIESMGGHIEVESTINVGTTFKVFLKR